MNLRTMQYLLSVSKQLSFSKASKECFISQPTLSEQIKKMEDFLELKIFERSNKKVFITDEGKEIIESARIIVKEIENIKEVAARRKDPFSGKLSLGAFPTLAPYIFPRLVPRIKQCLPNLRLILIEEKTEILLNKLKKGEIDAALLALPIEENGLEYTKLFEDEFYLAVPPEHSLANRKTIHMNELKTRTLLLLEEGHCLRDQALEVCSTTGTNIDEFKATSLETLRHMIKAGTGITFMPEIAMAKNEPGIKYIPFQEPKPKRTIVLVYRSTTNKRRILSSIEKFF